MATTWLAAEDGILGAQLFVSELCVVVHYDEMVAGRMVWMFRRRGEGFVSSPLHFYGRQSARKCGSSGTAVLDARPKHQVTT